MANDKYMPSFLREIPTDIRAYKNGVKYELSRDMYNIVSTMLNNPGDFIIITRKDVKHLSEDDKYSSIMDKLNEISTAVNTTTIKEEMEMLRAKLQEVITSVSEPKDNISAQAMLYEKLTSLEKSFELSQMKLTNEISDKFNTFDPLRSAKSVDNGSFGEHYIENIFANMGLHLDIQNMSKTPHMCDLHVVDVSKNILYAIEVKNYKGTVPTPELDKFQRDLENIRSNKEMFGNYSNIVGMFFALSDNLSKHGEMWVDSNGDIYLTKKYINEVLIRMLLIYFGQLNITNKNDGKTDRDILSSQEMKILNGLFEKVTLFERNKLVIEDTIKSLKKNIKQLKEVSDNNDAQKELIENFMKLFKAHSAENDDIVLLETGESEDEWV